MADEIGSLNDTIESLADELGMSNYDVLDYPGPMSLDDLMEQFTGGMVSSPIKGIESVVQGIVGPQAWPAVRQRIDGAIMLQNQPVMLMDPNILIIR